MSIHLGTFLYSRIRCPLVIASLVSSYMQAYILTCFLRGYGFLLYCKLDILGRQYYLHFAGVHNPHQSLHPCQSDSSVSYKKEMTDSHSRFSRLASSIIYVPPLIWNPKYIFQVSFSWQPQNHRKIWMSVVARTHLMMFLMIPTEGSSDGCFPGLLTGGIASDVNPTLAPDGMNRIWVFTAQQ